MREKEDANRLPLPDTRRWQPRVNKSETLEQMFFLRCQQLEQRIIQQVDHEILTSIDNFDSGVPVEDLIREGIRELLPSRYSVTSGVLSDSLGYTAGDVDIVVFNEHWFPMLKPGATRSTRRRYLPVDGAYAVFEVKQTLGLKSLDEAAEKLVRCKRLYRRPAPPDRVVENTAAFDSSCDHHMRNPLFSGIITARMSPSVTLDEIVDRFVRINQTLPRLDVINCLCILGVGTLLWSYHDNSPNEYTYKYGQIKPALFMREDLYAELMLALCGNKTDESPFFEMIRHLLAVLYHSVLAAEDVAVNYGLKRNRIQVPSDSKYKLDVDPIMIYRLAGKHLAYLHSHDDETPPSGNAL